MRCLKYAATNGQSLTIVAPEGRPKVTSEPAVLSCLVCAAAGDANTIDSATYTVRVIQPEGSQVRRPSRRRLTGQPSGRIDRCHRQEIETANQPDSQGATDALVPAEEGQAKEWAWELFTG